MRRHTVLIKTYSHINNKRQQPTNTDNMDYLHTHTHLIIIIITAWRLFPPADIGEGVLLRSAATPSIVVIVFIIVIVVAIVIVVGLSAVMRTTHTGNVARECSEGIRRLRGREGLLLHAATRARARRVHAQSEDIVMTAGRGRSKGDSKASIVIGFCVLCGGIGVAGAVVGKG